MFVEYIMTLPDYGLYTDIINKSQIPVVPPASLTAYLQSNNKSFDEKCRLLYEQRYLRYVRVVRWNDLYYIASSVWAEMKKHTNYKVDICIDAHGIVQEAQCECGAGQGPSAHCKHIVTVLYGLQKLCADEVILTEQTCTQVLQTFHQAKPYTGSPMSTADLHDLRKNQYIFDPRPSCRIKDPQYPAYFRNTVLNYQGDGRMPVTQLYGPANPYALSDHSLLKTDEMLFLEQEKILSISREDCISMQQATIGQHTNVIWKQQRTFRLTSSNFGQICKATARMDRTHLAESMVSPKAFSGRAVQHGLQYESVAVKQFEKQYMPTVECGMFVCEDVAWLAASPDRVISDEAILEVKCPFSAKNKAITSTTVPYLKDSYGNLKLDTKHNYYYQIQGQLLCSDRNKCYFCVYTCKDMQVIEIERDASFISAMIDSLKEFFQDYFLPALLRRYVYKYYDSYNWNE